MKATVEITINDKVKVVTKEHENIEVLKDWIINMSKNPAPILGYTEDGTFAAVTCQRKE